MPAFDRRRFIQRLAAGLAASAWLGIPKRAEAGSGPFLGEIMLVAWNFPPKGWAFCNGQFLPIFQNQGLFSLLGTTYGGNGVTTFALPDLRDRVPIHFGQGTGLSARALGESAGATTHTLVSGEMPMHGHALQVYSGSGGAVSPSGNYPARNAAGYAQYAASAVNTAMSSSAIGSAGGSQPHPNVQPYLGLRFCIALQGVFPSQT